MPLSEAQKQAMLRYVAKTYKRIPLDVRKEDYAVIKATADIVGESVNGFIKQAINDRIEKVRGDEAKLNELNFSMEEE